MDIDPPLDLHNLDKLNLPQAISDITYIAKQLLTITQHIEKCRSASGCARVTALYTSHRAVQPQQHLSCGQHQGLILQLQCSACCAPFNIYSLPTVRGGDGNGGVKEELMIFDEPFRNQRSMFGGKDGFTSMCPTSGATANTMPCPETGSQQTNPAQRQGMFIGSDHPQSRGHFDTTPASSYSLTELSGHGQQPSGKHSNINRPSTHFLGAIPHDVGSSCTDALSSLTSMFTPIVTITNPKKNSKKKRKRPPTDDVQQLQQQQNNSGGKAKEDVPFKNVLCKCRNECWRVGEADRRRQYDMFRSLATWNAQSALLRASVVETPVRSHRKTPEQRQRSKNILYFLGRRQVCRAVFLSTYGISSARIAYLVNRKSRDSAALSPDRRGRHTPGNKTSPETEASIKAFLASFPRSTANQARSGGDNYGFDPQLTMRKMHRMYLEGNPGSKVSPFVFKKVFIDFGSNNG